MLFEVGNGCTGSSVKWTGQEIPQISSDISVQKVTKSQRITIRIETTMVEEREFTM